MDANLNLQVETFKRAHAGAKSVPPAASAAAAAAGGNEGRHVVAKNIVTMCCGTLNPFDFFLTNDQHKDLYLSGQLCTHIHAARAEQDSSQILPNEGLLQAMLFMLHLT